MAQPRRSPPDDAFLMDWENSIWERHWDARNGIPKGRHRDRNAEWAATIRNCAFSSHTGVPWQEYVQWVLEGGEDEWFQEEEEALFCTRHQNGPVDVR